MISKTRTVYHVDLEEAKNHLRVDADFLDDDELINEMIEAAHEIAENFIEKQIALTTCVMTLNDFSGSVISVPEGNFISLTSVVDGDSIEYTKDFINIYDDHFDIHLDESINVDQVIVTFEAGFEEDSCPAAIKTAIKIKVADLYDTERGSYTLALQNNKTFEVILVNYKPFRMNHFRTT